MSHYQKIKCQIREAALLIEALKKLGYSNVEHHEEAQHLYGYMGDRRPETAEIIIRRKSVGRLSNDIGFKRQDNGEFTAIISDYDRSRHNTAWLQKLNKEYAYSLVKAYAVEQDLVVESEVVGADGEIVILLSERG